MRLECLSAYDYDSASTADGFFVRGNSSVENGGGIYDYLGECSFEGVTIAGNTANVSGGGLYSNGALQFEATLVAFNASTAAGIYISPGLASLRERAT